MVLTKSLLLLLYPFPLWPGTLHYGSTKDNYSMEPDPYIVNNYLCSEGGFSGAAQHGCSNFTHMFLKRCFWVFCTPPSLSVIVARKSKCRSAKHTAKSWICFTWKMNLKSTASMHIIRTGITSRYWNCVKVIVEIENFVFHRRSLDVFVVIFEFEYV